jgi:acetolactate synthase-1/2/3 large subunit
MKVTDYIASFLYAQEVKTVYVLIGGMITHLLDSIHLQGKIRIVDVHHEQAAAFAAEAAARMTGVPGVAMGTSGPGATNLLTGIGSCYFDSSPAVFITGQVNRSEQKGDLPIRQLGFQETDIVAVARPLTKAAWRVTKPEEVPALLREAFRLALTGRPGPVLLDIPMDVQYAEIDIDMDEEPPHKLEVLPAPRRPESAKVADLLDALRAAQRPLILAGGGIRSGRAADLLRAFVDKVRVPVVNSLMGVDALPCDSSYRMGLIGSYGNRWANLAVGAADFLLVVGSRLDIRQTGAQADAFKGERIIYHVDCDPGELNNRVQGCIEILAELRPFFAEAQRQAEGQTFPARAEWLDELHKLRQEWPDTAELRDIKGINPNALMHDISACSGRAAAFVIDVGQHQMWAAQSIDAAANQRFITSGGMGAMGFALPAAIGVATAQPGQPVVVVAGDGGFQLNIQEFQTILRNKLPIKVVILNNHCHGMVRQFQQSYFEERYQSTYWDYSAPEFAQVARAYGIEAARVSTPDELPAGLAALWQNPEAPFVLEVEIDTFANAYPKLAFGHSITEMEPFVKPIGMEGT